MSPPADDLDGWTARAGELREQLTKLSVTPDPERELERGLLLVKLGQALRELRRIGEAIECVTEAEGIYSKLPDHHGRARDLRLIRAELLAGSPREYETAFALTNELADGLTDASNGDFVARIYVVRFKSAKALNRWPQAAEDAAAF